MPDISRLLFYVCIAGGITLLTRALPFLLFSKRSIPPVILYLGKTLPLALMLLLVLFCIKDISFSAAVGFLPQLLALALTVGIHLYKRSTTLSIFCGTVCYMILIRVL